MSRQNRPPFWISGIYIYRNPRRPSDSNQNKPLTLFLIGTYQIDP